MAPDALPDPIRIAVDVGSLLDRLGIRVFVAGYDPFDTERLSRRTRVRLDVDSGSELWVDLPEHTILRKLEWYRRGGEVSERQWRDALGVLRAQGARLDQARLAEWAERLGVSDLLVRAQEEVE